MPGPRISSAFYRRKSLSSAKLDSAPAPNTPMSATCRRLLSAYPHRLTSIRDQTFATSRTPLVPCRHTCRPGQLVISESTTYPGTTEEVLIPLLEANNPQGLRCFRDGLILRSAFMWRILRNGKTLATLTVERERYSQSCGRASPGIRGFSGGLYGSIFNRIVRVSSPAAAEMTKLLENIYRCVNIALVNELKLLCRGWTSIYGRSSTREATKPFGFQPFYPGPGLGGHCIPIDPFYLSWKAKELDFQHALHRAGRRGQHFDALPRCRMRRRRAERAQQAAERAAAFSSWAFPTRKDIDDLRESPSLTLIEQLRRRGAWSTTTIHTFPQWAAAATTT